MPSVRDLAKRALITLLKSLATAYGLVLTLTRDSADKAQAGGEEGKSGSDACSAVASKTPSRPHVTGLRGRQHPVFPLL